jgi:hypothetical protein
LSHHADEQLDDLAAFDVPALDPADNLPQILDRHGAHGRTWRRRLRRRRPTAPPGVDGFLFRAAFVGSRIEAASPIGLRPTVAIAAAEAAADVAATGVTRVRKDRNAAVAAANQPAAEVRPQTQELTQCYEVAGRALAGFTKAKPIRSEDEGIDKPGYPKARASRTLSILFLCIVPFYPGGDAGG